MLNNKKDIAVGDKKNWYSDRYEFVSVQRNFFAIVTLLSLVLSLISTFALYQIAPLKTVEPFVIQVDQKTGVTQVVDPVRSPELTGNEAVNQYFIVQYCRARESFLGSPDRNYYNYNLVRVLSTGLTFKDFQHEIILSNPESPGSRLGTNGMRTIHIASIKYLDRHKTTEGFDTLRYLVRAQITESKNGEASGVLHKLILIEFRYADLDLTTEDRYLNPLGFQVISYHADDDTLNP
ncbi:MAG TPA: type IV secretion system protein [Rickettsiales bacterium]|nr:type IV secretion system protein [Rickettsiales bacterium]